jgi:hypothetical protein
MVVAGCDTLHSNEVGLITRLDEYRYGDGQDQVISSMPPRILFARSLPITLHVKERFVMTKGEPREVTEGGFAERLLCACGFKVVSQDTVPGADDLSVSITGEPISAFYVPEPSGYVGGVSGLAYSGARVKVEILFSSRERHFRWEWVGVIAPPESIPAGMYKEPEDAPFSLALNGAYILGDERKQIFPECCYYMVRLAVLITQIYGEEPLLIALSSGDLEVVPVSIEATKRLRNPQYVDLLRSLLDSRFDHEAAIALGEIGDPRPVPELITCIEKSIGRFGSQSEESPLVSPYIRALTRITGQRLGTDVRAWHKWWAVRSESIRSR